MEKNNNNNNKIIKELKKLKKEIEHLKRKNSDLNKSIDHHNFFFYVISFSYIFNTLFIAGFFYSAGYKDFFDSYLSIMFVAIPVIITIQLLLYPKLWESGDDD